MGSSLAYLRRSRRASVAGAYSARRKVVREKSVYLSEENTCWRVWFLWFVYGISNPGREISVNIPEGSCVFNTHWLSITVYKTWCWALQETQRKGCVEEVTLEPNLARREHRKWHKSGTIWTTNWNPSMWAVKTAKVSLKMDGFCKTYPQESYAFLHHRNKQFMRPGRRHVEMSARTYV